MLSILCEVTTCNLQAFQITQQTFPPCKFELFCKRFRSIYYIDAKDSGPSLGYKW